MAKTELQLQYTKELRRIKRFIASAEKRGYTFPQNAIPKQPKNIRPESVSRLQKINPETLYKKAKYTHPETRKQITGTQGRKIERSKASKKGVITKGQTPKTPQIPKAKKKKKQKTINNAREEYYKNADREAGTDRTKSPESTDNILIYVEQEIERWQPASFWSDWTERTKERHKNTLNSILQGAIAREGRKAVADRLEARAEEITKLTEEILYKTSGGKNSGKDFDLESDIQFKMNQFNSIILNRALTQEEAEAVSDYMESLNEYV